MTALRALMAVMAVVFSGSCVIFALLAIRRWREQSRLRGWRRVDGAILHVDLETRPDGSARPRVRYRFEWEGQPKEGEGVEEALASFLPAARAAALQRRFVDGTSVQVRVDPADPSRSVFESGMAPRGGVLVIASAGFAALALAFWAGAVLLG